MSGDGNDLQRRVRHQHGHVAVPLDRAQRVVRAAQNQGRAPGGAQGRALVRPGAQRFGLPREDVRPEIDRHVQRAGEDLLVGAVFRRQMERLHLRDQDLAELAAPQFVSCGIPHIQRARTRQN